MTNPLAQASPFKFLDAYQKADADIFFGRKEETKALYNAMSGVKHLLVFGPSGAGKTSLIECGLRNQYSDADWFGLTIRRGNQINASVFYEINALLSEGQRIPIDPETRLPQNQDIGFEHALELLFEEFSQPVYLIFDQFEELLLSGSEAEQKMFFVYLNRLIRQRISCRVLLVMREEFLGHLSEFESLCPSILLHRFRVEKMNRHKVVGVIQQTLDALRQRGNFEVEDSAALASGIVEKLPDDRREIELTYVQVFLDELWHRAGAPGSDTDKRRLGVGLLKDTDKLQSVLDNFLKKQLEELAAAHGEKQPLEVLSSLISERHTKLQLDADTLGKELEENKVTLLRPLQDLLSAFVKRRILREVKSGEQTQYEITHDILARVVGQNRTEEMLLREKAERTYEVYLEKPGLFSAEDLKQLELYQQYLPLPEALADRIKESKAYLEKVEEDRQEKLRIEAEKIRKARRRAIIIGLIAALLVLGAVVSGIWAMQQSKKARDAGAEAEKQKGVAKSMTQQAAAEKGKADSMTRFAKTKESEAEKNYNDALAKEKKAQDLLEKLVRNRNKQADAVYKVLQNYDSALVVLIETAKLPALKDSTALRLLEVGWVLNASGETGRALRAARAAQVLLGTSVALPARMDSLGYPDPVLAQAFFAMWPKGAVRWQDPKIKMIKLAGGAFKMESVSSFDELYIQDVLLSDFSIGETEVTQAQWLAVMGENQSHFHPKNGEEECLDCPVEQVSWWDAQRFLYRSSLVSGRLYRLPTEAEWEYAARGGASTHAYPYAGGEDVDQVAWHYVNSSHKTQPVREKDPNELGLYDMSGNVCEWCQDWYDDYSAVAQTNPVGPNIGAFRVLRGGSWFGSPQHCRVATRNGSTPAYRDNLSGFRLASQ